MTVGKLSATYLANIEIVYWAVRSSSMRGKDKGMEKGNRYFSQLKVLLY